MAEIMEALDKHLSLLGYMPNIALSMEPLLVIKTLAPVLVSLAIIVLTRKTVLGLLVGMLLGSILVVAQDSQNWFVYLGNIMWGALANPWHYSALVFTLALGGFASLLKAGGGLERVFRSVNTPRAFELRAIGIGFLCFFDGLANSLLIGRIGGATADRVGVSRQKLAYLADTTSSSVACLAPVSTWIAMQLGLIGAVLAERGIETSPYQIFLYSIPVNFYCLTSLLLAFGLAIAQREIGPMKHCLVVKESKVNWMFRRKKVSLVQPLTAIITVLLSIPVLYYLLETEELLPIRLDKLSAAMGGGSGPKVFLYASGISIVVAFLTTNILSVSDRFGAMWMGVQQMLLPLTVLLSAWLFGAVMSDLGLIKLMAALDLLNSLRWLPVTVFLLGCLLSFVTGTSWGTMALLFPIAFGAIGEIPDAEMLRFMPVLVAAILSGAVFGDHCSPYSDTTIVSAVAAKCEAYEHVRTQLPYALICGGVSAVFFVLVGFVIS